MKSIETDISRSRFEMVRVSHKIRFLFFLFLFCFAANFVSSENMSAQENRLACNFLATLKDFHIPFTLDKISLFPCITLKLDDIPLNMSVAVYSDKFSQESQIYLSGIRKLGVFDDMIDALKLKAASMYDKQVEQVMDRDLSNVMISGNAVFTLLNVSSEGQYLGKISTNYINLQEEYPELNNVDGELNLSLFSLCNNIVIDYRNNEVIINAPPISEKGTPMHQFYDFYAVCTKVKINGVEQDAIIVPTLSAVYLRDENKSSKTYTDEEIIEYGKTGTPRSATNKYKNIVVQIGDVEVSCKGYLTSRRRLELQGAGAVRMVRKINFLGYPVFKGHRIQLDFKNWIFRMD